MQSTSQAIQEMKSSTHLNTQDISKLENQVGQLATQVGEREWNCFVSIKICGTWHWRKLYVFWEIFFGIHNDNFYEKWDLKKKKNGAIVKEKKWCRTKYLIKYYLPCQSILVIIYFPLHLVFLVIFWCFHDLHAIKLNKSLTCAMHGIV